MCVSEQLQLPAMLLLDSPSDSAGERCSREFIEHGNVGDKDISVVKCKISVRNKHSCNCKT